VVSGCAFGPFWVLPGGSGGPVFGSLPGPPGQETGSCWALIGPFWPSWPGPLCPVSACFWVVFGGGSRPVSGPFGPENPFSGFTARSLGGPFWARFGAWFRVFFACFRPLSASGRKEPNPYRLVTGSRGPFSPVFRVFGLFRPFWGPSGPQTPVLGFTARSFGALWALFRRLFWPPSGATKRRRPAALGAPFGAQMYHFWPLLGAPFGGTQKRPSRGLPPGLRAPNVPLLGPLLGPFRPSLPWGPKIRRHSTVFLASGQKDCRMPPDFGAPGIGAPKGPQRARRAPGPRFWTSVWPPGSLLGPKPD